jgi:Wiskott-Aldrich syndrome protein
MPSTQFKLTRNNHTRRLTLADQPNWLALATRIESYFNIPVDKVAVAYTDADGDEVTLSSQEELLDFFTNFHKPGDPVKFNVVDLSKLRSAGNGSAAHSEKSHISPAGLGAMGPTMFFEMDDRPEWPPLPRFFSAGGIGADDLLDDSDGNQSAIGHAYVETVHSEESSSQKRSNPRAPSRLSKSSVSTLKGKEKAEGVAAASTVSLIDEDVPDKPTLHVKAVPVTDAGASPRMSGLRDWQSPASVRSAQCK